jgi:predicted nucleic acid-binding protein
VILLDTSVLSRVFRRKRPGPVERHVQEVFNELMASDMPLGLPGIVLQEILSGIRSPRQFDDLAAKLTAGFAIVPEGVREHIEAARIKNACLAKGLNASGGDCLIAACAVVGDHELFAADADIEAIARHTPLKLFNGHGIALAAAEDGIRSRRTGRRAGGQG